MSCTPQHRLALREDRDKVVDINLSNIFIFSITKIISKSVALYLFPMLQSQRIMWFMFHSPFLVLFHFQNMTQQGLIIHLEPEHH